MHLTGGDDFWVKMGREPFTNEEANVLTHFFNRLWFERMWVIQEVALATHIRVLCGTLEIDWDDLVTISIYLFNSGHASAWHRLRVKAFGNPHVRPIAVAPMQMNKLRNGCMGGIMTAEDTVLSMEELQAQDTDVMFCKFLMLMIFIGRGYQCGRPVDKVFAPLSLVLYKFLNTKSSKLMLPDYSKSVQQVYTEVTSLIIRMTSDLTLLTRVEDPSHTSLKGLPSWVPDFSTIGSSPLLTLKFRPKFNATEGCGLSFSAITKGNQLITQACWIDTVFHRGPYHDNLSFSYTFKGCPSPFLRFALSMGEKYLTGESAIMAFIRTFIADQMPDIYEPWMLSNFNAYARYCLVGSEDMDNVLEEAKRLTGLQNATEILQAFSEHPEHLPSWPELDSIESRGGGPMPTFRQLILWARVLCNQSDYEQDPDRVLVDVARHVFEECHFGAMSARRFLKGRLGYVGLIPQSGEIDDELWILPGCKTPCTLRPTEKKGEYRFIGEAYVHGVMYGELWKSENRPCQSSIVLV